MNEMDALQMAKKYVDACPHITSNRDKIAVDIAIMMTGYAQEQIADVRKIVKLPNLTEHAKKLKPLLDEAPPTLARYDYDLPENLL